MKLVGRAARLRVCLLSAILPASGWAFGQAASTRVTAVRFWSLGEVTRVAIETDGEAGYHAERIDTPDRLFVDLVGVHRPSGTRGVQTIQVGDRLVKQIRVAVVQPGVTRVVLDLTGAHEFLISQLTNPDRIIVELRMAGPSPALPPVRSITGSHAILETSDTGGSLPPDISKKSEVSVSAKAEPSFVAPPAVRKPDTPIQTPPKIEPAGTKKAEVAIAKADPPEVPKTEQPAAPFVPPAETVRRDAALPEPPRMTPRKQGLDSRPPLEIAQAAKRDSRGDRTLIRALGLKLDRVVLDPGHGGHDTGTVGPGGMMEKTLVLDVAHRLGVLIRDRLGSEVIYTRADDTFIPLEERTRIANDRKADLFLSIHANSSRAQRISGSETFYLNFTTSEDALEVAARENATSQTSIHELQTLVQKIALNEKVQESRELASVVQASLYTGIPRNRGLRNRGVKKAPFVVLIGAQMPSVLAEIAFLSNPRDEAMLKKPDYRQKIAEALFKGVSQYANTLSHFQVARQQPTASQAQ